MCPTYHWGPFEALTSRNYSPAETKPAPHACIYLQIHLFCSFVILSNDCILLSVGTAILLSYLPLLWVAVVYEVSCQIVPCHMWNLQPHKDYKYGLRNPCMPF